MSWRHHPLAVAVAASLLLHTLLLLGLPLVPARRLPAPAPLQVELLADGEHRPPAPSAAPHSPAVPVSPVNPARRVAPAERAVVAPVPGGMVLPGQPAAMPAPVGAPGSQPGRGDLAAPGDRSVIEPARFLGNARNPPYPERARALGLEGRVEAKVTIGAGGEVQNVELLHSSGEPELDRAALALLAAGPYAPARRAGVAMASRLRIGVPYTLNK